MNRVRFFSTNDGACGYYLIQSERVLDELAVGKKLLDINDMIEIYCIRKYFENKIYLKKWTKQDIEKYEELVKSNYKVVIHFFCEIHKTDFLKLYNEVVIQYKKEFWELVALFCIYKNISNKVFMDFISNEKPSLHLLLLQKKIIENFDGVIREYMLASNLSAQLLLDKYEMKHLDGKEPKYYFPKILTLEDKEKIIINYIDSTNPNPNYLGLIVNVQSNDKLRITPKTMLKAKRKMQEQENQFFNDNTGIEIKMSVVFSESENEEVIIQREDFTMAVTYNLNWIRDNTDCPTLLNNFIYLFVYVDSQMRCTLVNKLNMMGVFERLMATSKKAYSTGFLFNEYQMLSLLQMHGYYNILYTIGIRLEEILEWFFEDYLPNEFNANDFFVTMPSSSSTVLEKCATVLPAMESVLKQFSLFVEERQIDYELLDIRSQHLWIFRR